MVYGARRERIKAAMTVLVTGATGFIGSAVMRQLILRGEAVRVLARRGGDRRNLAGLEIEIVEGDLNDADARARATRGVTGVFHVAADYRLWVPDPAAMYGTNVDATVDLLRRAADAGANRIVYTSSVATLGLHADATPSDEDTAVDLADMIGPYKRSKFMAEDAVRGLADAGLPIVIVNPTAPVGPRDIKPTPTGRMVIEAAAGRMPAFVDTGLNIVHVDDVARGHVLARDKGVVGQRYILGGENVTHRQAFSVTAEITGNRPPFLPIHPATRPPLNSSMPR